MTTQEIFEKRCINVDDFGTKKKAITLDALELILDELLKAQREACARDTIEAFHNGETDYVKLITVCLNAKVQP